MARTWSREIKYKCSQDCQQSGCPSHTFRVRWDRTVDLIYLEFDGKDTQCIEMGEFEAMIKLYKEIMEPK